MLEVDDLRQVRPLDRGTEFDLACARFLSEQDLQKRRLARAVVAQKRDALAACNLQVHVMEERPSVKRLAEPLHGQHLVAEEIPLGKARAHGLLRLRLFGLFNPVHPVLDGHRAPVERAVVDAPALHALERKAQLRELGLLFFILLELKLKARLLFLHVERIVAGIKLRLAVRYFNDAADDAV